MKHSTSRKTPEQPANAERRARIEQLARDILKAAHSLDDGDGDPRQTFAAVCTAALCDAIARNRAS
jgi:hypothetical protein